MNEPHSELSHVNNVRKSLVLLRVGRKSATETLAQSLLWTTGFPALVVSYRRPSHTG
jgi:hypothetical protein